MAALDLSGIEFFLPIISFLLVFIIVYAVLAKYKLLGSKIIIDLFVAFLVAVIFLLATSARDYLINITPWFGVFVVTLAFILMLIGFAGKTPEWLTKGVGIIFVVGLLLLFIVSAYFSFSSTPVLSSLWDWIKTPKVFGALILLAVGGLASWILVKFK
ncbi:MAG: hypothetical protein MUF61_03075 [archaeon]|jgi:hypothetical protein|nr:hypothetical protein [archaeon]